MSDKQAILQYLDDLRESGAVNMLGAAPRLAEEFGMPASDARVWISEWIRTYADRHPPRGEGR